MLESMVSSSLLSGFATGLLVLGVVISLRILDFPDLTVDGSFVLGAAVGARLFVDGHVAPVACFAALMAGFAAGCCTGMLHTKCGMSKLLAGILMATILYSVNFRVMRRPNVTLIGHDTLPDLFRGLTGSGTWGTIVLFAAIAVVAKVLMDILLRTEWGTILRAVGDNEHLVDSLGFSKDLMKIYGLGLANGLVALSGTLVSQYQGFADVNMGIGTIILGVASLILGEALILLIPRWKRRVDLVAQRTLAALLGAVAYQGIVNTALRLGITPTDLKMATALLVIAAVLVGRWRGHAFAGIDRY